MSDQQLLHNLMLNLLIGAVAGAVICTALLLLNAHDIASMLQHSTSPIVATVILITGASMYFAFGAAITGFHFAITDQNYRGRPSDP
jgi:hypothetical protein